MTNLNKRRLKSGSAGSGAMKLIRRIHLYAGLLMLPWVLLYGFTALLFNHSTLFPDSDTTIHRFQSPAAATRSLPGASALAELIVAQLNEEPAGANAPARYRLVNPANAIYTREAVATARTDDRRYTVVMNLDNGDGYVREQREKDKSKGQESMLPLEGGQDLSLPVGEMREEVGETMRKSLSRLGLEVGEIVFATFPTVEFDIKEKDRVYRARFVASRPRQVDPMMQSGRLTLVGQGTDALGWRRYLLRLHMTHGYPLQRNARWYWAIAVDAMFATMTFWGFSGVLMWWQLKRTRLLGALCLLLSAVVATLLAIGMHAQLAR